MNQQIRWQADAELVALLRSYYGGNAELWGAIQKLVHAELRARGLSLAPRHVRFRPEGAGYAVILDDAEAYSAGG
jgi:hypothetical protein